MAAWIVVIYCIKIDLHKVLLWSGVVGHVHSTMFLNLVRDVLIITGTKNFIKALRKFSYFRWVY